MTSSRPSCNHWINIEEFGSLGYGEPFSSQTYERTANEQFDIRLMFIGVCTFEVHVPESGSLKTKRHSIRSLKDRIRNKFNVSVAEVDDNDLWQKARLAVAAVSNDKAYLNQTLDHVLEMVRGVPELSLLDYQIEIF